MPEGRTRAKKCGEGHLELDVVATHYPITSSQFFISFPNLSSTIGQEILLKKNQIPEHLAVETPRPTTPSETGSISRPEIQIALEKRPLSPNVFLKWGYPQIYLGFSITIKFQAPPFFRKPPI